MVAQRRAHLERSRRTVTGNGSTKTLFDPVRSALVSIRLWNSFRMSRRLPRCLRTEDSKSEAEAPPPVGRWIRLSAVLCMGFARTTTHTAARLTFEVYLASTGAGPVVQFNQAGPVTGGTPTHSPSTQCLPGSAGCNAQWRILWNSGGDTGYQTLYPREQRVWLVQQFGLPLPSERRRRPSISTLRARRIQTSRPRLTLMTLARFGRRFHPAPPASPMSCRWPRNRSPISAGQPPAAYSISPN